MVTLQGYWVIDLSPVQVLVSIPVGNFVYLSYTYLHIKLYFKREQFLNLGHIVVEKLKSRDISFKNVQHILATCMSSRRAAKKTLQMFIMGGGGG